VAKFRPYKQTNKSLFKIVKKKFQANTALLKTKTLLRLLCWKGSSPPQHEKNKKKRGFTYDNPKEEEEAPHQQQQQQS
jgi:hypothetical protein